MSTYVQSASSSPTARDLLTLLQSLSEEDLDKPVGCWDNEYGDYDNWMGMLEVTDEEVGISYEMSDAKKVEWDKQRRDAAARLQAERMTDPAYLSHSAEIDAAREAGLLPPGA
jgi:hypothetical protein